MRIYTKTGDTGKTSLIGGERVNKYDVRVEAYGNVDELMSFVALLGDNLRTDVSLADIVEDTLRINSQLMTVASLLAVGAGGEGKIQPLKPEAVEYLESRIDAMQAEVPPITKFTIPGGDARVSMCHVCRTVCRRAERGRTSRCCAVSGSMSRRLLTLTVCQTIFTLPAGLLRSGWVLRSICGSRRLQKKYAIV